MVTRINQLDAPLSSKMTCSGTQLVCTFHNITMFCSHLSTLSFHCTYTYIQYVAIAAKGQKASSSFYGSLASCYEPIASSHKVRNGVNGN